MKQQKRTSLKTTTKRALWFCLGNGVGWVWCSYILAYLGKESIAEKLSQTAVTEIVGVVANTGATGWDWRLGCAFNRCFQ